VDPGPLRDLLTAALGLLTGAMSGAFGVGGATISTPGIRALGVPALLAVGTTLPSIFPSAASGALRYQRERLIDREAVILTIPVGFAAAIVGAFLAEVVPGDGHPLMIGTAGLLAFTAFRMAAAARSVAPAVDESAVADPDEPAAGRRSRGAFALVGGIAGLLSGLLGIGGGVVMVPGFHSLAGLSIKSSIATSLVCVATFALPGTVTHAALGNIDWRVALFLTLTVIPGARLGAALTMRADDRRLRLAVATFLGAISLLYAGGEIAALL
jgi:uncharacterized membrane protein YfcA